MASGKRGGGGRQNPTKDNGVPLLSAVINIVKYCGVGGGGGGSLGGAKILQMVMPAPLSVSKIVRYRGVWGGGGVIGGRQNPTKDNGAPSLCH